MQNVSQSCNVSSESATSTADMPFLREKRGSYQASKIIGGLSLRMGNEDFPRQALNYEENLPK